MSVTNPSIDIRDYMRVIFSRAWWLLFVTLGVTAGAFYWSFHRAARVYEAHNEIVVTDRYSAPLSKDIGRNPDWVTRVMKAELEFKRSVPSRAIVVDAANAVGVDLSAAEVAGMVKDFKNDMKVGYLKKGDLIEVSYEARDGKLAAAAVSLFIKRLINYCVTMQVDELNTEIRTLLSLRARLDAEVGAAERKLDAMKTIPPELRLTASTMALLKNGKELTTGPSTEQAIHVFLELQRDIIMLDGEIADTASQIDGIRKQIGSQPEAVASQKRLETMPAVRDATKRRGQLRLELVELLTNSTAEHPMVKDLQAQIKSLDAYLRTAATDATVEIVFEANKTREEFKSTQALLERKLEGLKDRRTKMQENAAAWREKLDEMPAALRTVREASLEYEKKTQNLSLITDRLVQAQIKRSLELDQVGTYYRATWELTVVPSKYRKPNHWLHLAMGLVLGMVSSVFLVYAMEFADHSVKDQRDLKSCTKAAVLGVISDYNQLKSVAARTVRARAAKVKEYLLALLYIAIVAMLVFIGWRDWPKPNGHEKLPVVLSADTVFDIEQAMKLYMADEEVVDDYLGDSGPRLDLAPAVELPTDTPEPILSK